MSVSNSSVLFNETPEWVEFYSEPFGALIIVVLFFVVGFCGLAAVCLEAVARRIFDGVAFACTTRAMHEVDELDTELDDEEVYLDPPK